MNNYCVNTTLTVLKNTQRILLNQSRTIIKDGAVPKPEGGIDYHGFTYYPRFPDQKDPPYTPTKLFYIERIKPYPGTTYIEKDIMKKYDINGMQRFNGHFNIVKNTPQVNKDLYKIKHLIKIIPIKFVNGLPKDGDYTGTLLKDNGEFIVMDKLKVDEKTMEATEKYFKDVKRLEGQTLKKCLRLKWLNPFDGVTV